MAVAIYCRVSTEEQRERQSILTQRDFGDRYTELHKLPIWRVYPDDGVSGTVPLEQRPEGSQVLKDARLGKFDQLLIYKLDRLGRETRLILNAVADLEKLGVRVRSMTEEFDTASATGRLMLTMLSGFATHEREVIRERSVAGTQRLAQSGAWLGGIVPYGYRKVGEKRDARLVISDEIVPHLGMSEADVVREIFQLSAVEKLSCRKIALHLNQMRVSCVYTRDDKLVVRGKRRHRTLGVWRGPRVRGVLTNTTYKGIHSYGKRTKSKRPPITRPVPAIVPEDTWKKAQANLKAHFLFSARSAKHKYLLRGLIKCKLCGLTYIGMKANGNRAKPSQFYYKCNGANTPELLQTRCTAKSVRGDDLEQQVWTDVEAFLRNPGPVLGQIQARLETEAQSTVKVRDRVKRLESLLEQKSEERSRILTLYRRGRLADASLDEQMEEIGKEEAALETQIEESRAQIRGADSVSRAVGTAEALLNRLRKRLDQRVSWELKRQLIEILVASIEVETIEVFGVKQARTTVTYRFNLTEQSALVLLPTSYTSVRRCVRIPIEPKTIGDHIRRTRLSMKLLQKDVAERLGVKKTTIYTWEGNYAAPEAKYMPAIMNFLGYNPLPAATNWAERLVRHRITLGLTQQESARRIGVDQSTLARWERGEREPSGAFVVRATCFLDTAVAELSPLQRTG
jgi:site-specific DNA recombinase